MQWNYRYTLLVLCTFAFFGTMVARLVISPLVPAITDSFTITNTAIGVALTGMWLAYALTQFPSGLLGDRYGERLIILVAVGGTAVMSFVLALAPVFPVFVVSVIVLGAVAGLHYSVATSLLTRTFDDQMGMAVGIHTIGSPAAGLFAPVAAAWVGTRYGWRAGIAIGAAIAAPIFVLFALRTRRTDPQRPDQPVSDRLEFAPLVDLLSTPPITFTVGIAAICAFVWQGTASFLPTFLVEYRGQSATLAGVVFSSYFVVQAVTKPVLGSLSDSYGRDSVIVGCMVTTVLGLVLFVAVPGALAVVAAIVLVGTGLGWASAVEPRFMDELGDRERSAGFGLVRTVYLVVGSLGSFAVGLFADAFGWAVSFGVLVCLLSLVAVAVVINGALELGY
ncbi:MFS transporter [Salinadaptatus halalkaliphilus]|uniref:MFS transporter n=1 Tax=Salinadaptatus halalkaliphilus TaxID=2419781 RepID=A0A4V3VLJ6_9EURY|nr:MFS transporter [Salinadaptatus halalkaliphilus]THE65737.1 MFS transporter [Salinadaptatus halalkaliphilus]